MGINAMENEVYQPQDANPLGKLFNVGPVFIVGLALLFGVAYGVKWLYGWYYTPAPLIRIANQMEAKVESNGYGKYCYDGKCVQVKLCTAISDECGDMTEGKPADYGTGFHISADGGKRPNPPAGWKWAGK